MLTELLVPAGCRVHPHCHLIPSTTQRVEEEPAPFPHQDTSPKVIIAGLNRVIPILRPLLLTLLPSKDHGARTQDLEGPSRPLTKVLPKGFSIPLTLCPMEPTHPSDQEP